MEVHSSKKTYRLSMKDLRELGVGADEVLVSATVTESCIEFETKAGDNKPNNVVSTGGYLARNNQ